MRTNNFKYFGILVLVFLISANIAWLNPTGNDPENPRLYKTHNKIPLFWQYNLDSGIEILTAAYFPKIFEINTTRIDRPTYPAVANSLGKLVSVVLKPLITLNNLERAGIGYIILKILIYSLSLILLKKFLSQYFDEKIIYLAIFFIYVNYHSIFYFTTFHTTELQFITPIFILVMFYNLIKEYSISKNILFSFLVGILMLAKPNYAIYLSIIIFLLYKKKFLEIFISLLSHITPIILYLLFIKYSNYEFNIIIATEYDQGVWLYEDLKEKNFINIFSLFFASLGKFFLRLFSGYDLLIIFSIIGFAYKYFKKELQKDYVIFILIFIFCTFFQIFSAQRFTEYMVYDISVIIYTFSAYGIYKIINKFKNNNIRQFSISFIMILYLSLNVAKFVHLPWVHPYDQVSKKAKVLNSKLSKLDDIIIED